MATLSPRMTGSTSKRGGKPHGYPKGKGTPRRAILAWDRLWIRRWQRIRLPHGLYLALFFFVRAGDGWIWIAVVSALALALPFREFIFLAGQGATAVGVSLPVYRLLKSSFRRPRPHSLSSRIVARVASVDTHSFPSGHTMNNMAVASALAFHLPWLWPFALVVPLLFGLLRVLFGVHFFSDVVAGVLFGLLAALMAFWVYIGLLVPMFPILTGD